MFPREKGELPNSIFISSEPASLEGRGSASKSILWRMWCGAKSGDWAASSAGCSSGGGGRGSRGGDADLGRDTVGGLTRSRGRCAPSGPGNPNGLKGKCSGVGCPRLGAREVGMLGRRR